ncbi:hypothetical protein QFC22_005712 [Naganishia vaughanmartiniae]|uniref:Uncharacterized protein n=1 Tax=Naganishia vaughanmartiniae TaxID=1424756 RepID=A0ACC2WSG7_9TREE|nr:hypothetical protein QFC22_005712 [Naganishia vaughanmartiniae]
MKAPLTATLLLLRYSLAKHTELPPDSLEQLQRHAASNSFSGALDNLMIRADERIPEAKANLWEGQEEEEEPERGEYDARRMLKGRFIHITDFHPDPHYVTGGSFDSGCHRTADEDIVAESLQMSSGVGSSNSISQYTNITGVNVNNKKDKKQEGAGKWGSGLSDCDSPMSLVNLTFDWLQKEWANEVDFVVWTGDNARHDIDREIPRTPKEIYELNRMMTGKMRETFGEDVVIVPSIGNNDIWPHNILQPGPNAVTNEFSNVWSDFIPAEEYHIFQRGAYYSSEVIPDRLAVISLNTIYWYDANKDGSDEPGALEFDWLEVQLDSFRERGMQVWLTGHVPPHLGVYFDNCYLRYGELALRYQDTIVGHLYGHQNVDHFFFIDVIELEETTGFAEKAAKAAVFDQGKKSFGRNLDTALQQALYKDFGEMPKVNKMKLEDYTVINVSPSVIPTYLPGIRVYNYNVTGLKLDEDGLVGDEQEFAGPDMSSQTVLPTTRKRKTGHRHSKKKKKKNDCNKPEHEDQPHCKFRQKERHFSPESPSRANTLFTPLGYTQFYLPGLDEQTHSPPKWIIEYATYSPEGLLRGGRNGTDGDAQGRQPVPWHLLPGYQEFVEREEAASRFADSNDNKTLKGHDQDDQDPYTKFKAGLKSITPYHLADLTIPSYAHFAKRLTSEKRLWKRFASAMYLTTKDEK